jgi:hypothetical protein
VGRFLCGASLHRVAAGTLRSHWKVRGLEDWASLPVLLLLLSGFLFVINLVGFSFRWRRTKRTLESASFHQDTSVL